MLGAFALGSSPLSGAPWVDFSDVDAATARIAAPVDQAMAGHGFVMRDIRSVRRPLVLRILAERASKKKAASYTSRKPAKQIEVQAAELALDNGSESAFDALKARWLVVSPPVAALPAPDAEALFFAHVAQALERIRIEREQLDEDEAVLALLMT